MKILVLDNVSDKFVKAIQSTLATFPEYIRKAPVELWLSKTIYDLRPDLDEDKWDGIPMLYNSSNNHIIISEFYRSSVTNRWRKNPEIGAAIAHESGHFFDDKVFGTSCGHKGYFSTDPEREFLRAWQADLSNLKRHPERTGNLDEIFNRHMEGDGFGARETFAELWSNTHGHSALLSYNIQSIRAEWTKCAAIVERLVNTTNFRTPKM